MVMDRDSSPRSLERIFGQAILPGDCGGNVSGMGGESESILVDDSEGLLAAATTSGIEAI